MADFRKWLLAFALVALLLGARTANAQPSIVQVGFTCTTNTETPVILGVGGITELVSDFRLHRDGQPTLKVQPVPITNLRLTLNTSEMISFINDTGYTEALASEPCPVTANLRSVTDDLKPPTNNKTALTIRVNSAGQDYGSAINSESKNHGDPIGLPVSIIVARTYCGQTTIPDDLGLKTTVRSWVKASPPSTTPPPFVQTAVTLWREGLVYGKS